MLGTGFGSYIAFKIGIILTGTTTTGKKIAVRGCDLFEFRDGKILRRDSYWKIVD